MAPKKEAEKTKPTELAKTKAQEDQAALALYGGDAGTGFEGTTADDYALPFLKLLQKMSPEVDEADGAYIEGAKPGMYVDTATGELLETMKFIPCYYHRAIVEWRDREEGGGFVAQHQPGYEERFTRNERGQWVTPNGTYLSDTRYFFGLRLRADGSTAPGVISFGSTQLKRARAWLTRLQALKLQTAEGFRPYPIYAHIWEFSSTTEENEKGKWCGYKMELVERITDQGLVNAARENHALFKRSATNLRPPAEPAGGGAADEVI
jgi:hypothetical protein